MNVLANLIVIVVNSDSNLNPNAFDAHAHDRVNVNDSVPSHSVQQIDAAEFHSNY